MKKWFMFLFLVVGLVVAYSWHIASLKPDSLQTIILSHSKLVPETQSAMRVLVRNPIAKKSIVKANVSFSLSKDGQKQIPLGNASSNTDGHLAFNFQVPKVISGSYTLEVTSSFAGKKDSEKIAVQIAKEYKILLNTDKPLYQPGQTIHIRTLTMDKFTKKPVAKEALQIEISDAKSNKVFRKKLTTSKFGIASCDFQLAHEVNKGNFKIKVIGARASAEKEVTVKNYVLPKFKITTKFNQKYYMPGQKVTGSINAQYFFGKPVANSKVEIAVSSFAIKFNKHLVIKGKTDARGNYNFEFTLPKKLYGTELQKGNALVKVDVKVLDQAQHTQKLTRNLIVSNSEIEITIIPASSHIVKGIKNTYYIVTNYPDGRPAITKIGIDDIKVKTNSLGIAKIQMLPKSFVQIRVKDSKGPLVVKKMSLNFPEGAFLAYLDKATYKVGEEAKLNIFSASKQGPYYIDVIKNNQTILSKMVSDKKELSFSLSQDMVGALTVDVGSV